MRISVIGGFFLPVPPVQGGAMEKIWHRLTREFAQRGHRVTYFTRQWPGFPDQERVEGVDMIRVRGFNHSTSLPRNLLLDFWWGLRVARRLPPGEVVVCNTVSLPVFLRKIRPGAGRVAVVLARMPKGQIRAYGAVERLIATSQAVKERCLLENPRLASRTRVIPNPIDWALHQAHSTQLAGGPGEIGRPLTIGYVGRMNPEKGVEILLEAAAILARRPGVPPWRLRLIGPQRIPEGGGGEAYVRGLRDQAARSGADASLEGPIYDPSTLAGAYGQMDVFCYPSLAEKGEGLSVAPIEAMAAGCVPVVSALDCFKDAIRHGENGLVFDHRAVDRAERLASLFVRLLSDPAERRRFSAAAVRDSRPFDYGAVAAELLDDFASIG